jgi:hypothetical protein
MSLPLLISVSLSAPAQARQGEEAAPAILRTGQREAIRSVEEFRYRREEIFTLFEENVYGKTPSEVLPLEIRQIKMGTALNGKAIRKQIEFTIGTTPFRRCHLLLYLPAHSSGPVPVIVGLNFAGNHTVSSDTGIFLTPEWVINPEAGVRMANELSPHTLQVPAESTRGSAASQWQVEEILNQGFGLATMYAGDIEPDFLGGIGYSIRALFSSQASVPKADSWGAIGAWAWGMSRIVDVLTQDVEVDSKHLTAFGFSRFGKTALWAAAQDQRFAAVLSNESGQAGATLSRREVGESIDHLMLAFPYWFSPNYQRYLGNAQSLPVDGHMLLALIAPRPLYVGSAAKDPFSDPEGEFLSAKAVSEVYKLYGQAGITERAMPPLNHPIGDGALRYHVRPGGHDVTAYDWQQYLGFLSLQFRAGSSSR